eukprot:756147-Hanusia_phi.AAC.2
MSHATCWSRRGADEQQTGLLSFFCVRDMAGNLLPMQDFILALEVLLLSPSLLLLAVLALSASSDLLLSTSPSQPPIFFLLASFLTFSQSMAPATIQHARDPGGVLAALIAAAMYVPRASRPTPSPLREDRCARRGTAASSPGGLVAGDDVASQVRADERRRDEREPRKWGRRLRGEAGKPGSRGEKRSGRTGIIYGRCLMLLALPRSTRVWSLSCR